MEKNMYRGFLVGGLHWQAVNDLNAAQIATHDGFEPLQDFSTISEDGKVRVFFKDSKIISSDIFKMLILWLDVLHGLPVRES